MLAFLRRWMAPESGQVGASSETEFFGQVSLPRSAGEDIVGGTALRKEMRQKIREVFTSFSPAQKTTLLDRLLVRYALYVSDLGASERNHHRDAYGLYEHSLEVALETLKVLRGPLFRASEDPLFEHHERPIWIYSGFVLGLLHDLGKVFDLDVLSPDGKELWNPMTEPLVGFLRRFGLRGTSDGIRRYHEGRGTKRHTWLLPLLVARILPGAALSYLGPRLPWIVDDYIRAENFKGEQTIPGVVGDVVETVRHFDRKTSRMGLAAAGTETEETGAANKNKTLSNGAPKEKKDASPATPGRIPPQESGSVQVKTSFESTILAGAGILDYFAHALALAAERNLLSMNCPGALAFVGPNHLYFKYPTAFDLIAGVMMERWSKEDARLREFGKDTSPGNQLFGVLRTEGKLHVFEEEKGTTFWGVVLHPNGEKEESDFALVTKDLLKAPLPNFEGRVAISTPLTGSPISVEPEPPPDVAATRASNAAEPEGTIQKPAQASPPPAQSMDSDEEPRARRKNLSRKLPVEFDSKCLFRGLREAIKSAALQRNTRRAQVFIRKTFTWLLYPEALTILATYLKIPTRDGGAEEILDVLWERDEFDPKSLLYARAFPEAQKLVPLVRIHTPELFSDQELGSLGCWEHEIAPIQGRPVRFTNLGGGGLRTPPKEKAAV